MRLLRWRRQSPNPKSISRTPKMITHAKAERLRRQAEQERREKRKSLWMLLGIVLLMVGAVVADYLFIQWGRYQRHRQQYHRQSVTNATERTNGPAIR